MEIYKLFDFVIERGGSDLHLIPGFFPTVRINGQLYQSRVSELLTDEATSRMLFEILTAEQKANLVENKEIDFGYDYNEQRFRVNIYHSRNKVAAAFRLIGSHIKSIEELNLLPIFHSFTQYNQGLILITGPTGEGKSTTLAAIINEINLNFAKHIITIEDPIEYVYPSGKSIISQRELHQDSHSLNVALRSVLREDPDVVLIGEMRDYETIQLALTIAETGHLVLSTLHTSSTAEAINRIIDVFPGNQQNQVRSQLSSVLRVIIAQRLVPNIGKTGMLPAIELLINIPSVATVIRENKNHLIDNILETAENDGLILLEKHLVSLYQKGLVSRETVLNYAIRQSEVKKFLK